jgi:hypothetical protein
LGCNKIFGDVDLDELKIDVVKQEPRQRVQMYFDCLDKLFRKGKIKDVEHKCRFLAHLFHKIKFCMVKIYNNVEEMLVATKDVKKVLGE